MLSPEQSKIIKEQLQQENVYEFVENLIMGYTTDTSRTGKLLTLIPKIADRQLQIKKKEVQDYVCAYNLLLGERLRCKSKSNKVGKPDFITLLYGCKAHFPNGSGDGGSQIEQKFFSEFIETVKRKVGFDYENKDDWGWICNTADCREWMLAVIKQHVNADFVEPDVRIRSYRARG